MRAWIAGKALALGSGMENIMETAHTALTGDAVRRLSSQIHESPTATERGLECAMPVSIAGLAMAASSERTAAELLRALRGGNYPHVGADELVPVVSDPSATNRLAESGEGLLSRIFGNKLDGIVDALAGQAGVSRVSAIKLLGLSAPLVLDAVGKKAQSRTLDANGLSRFLDDQSRAATSDLPEPVSNALADARKAVPGPSAETRVERQEWRPGERRAMSEQAQARAGGVIGTAKQRMEGAAADVRARASHLGEDVRERAGDVRERLGDARDDLRHRARGTDIDEQRRHVSAAETIHHERRPSRGLMWLLAAIVLIGALALLVARARRRPVEPLPQGNVQGIEAPRTPPITAPQVPERREAVPPAAPRAAREAPAAAEPGGVTAPPESTLGEQQATPPPTEAAADAVEVLTVGSGAGPVTIFLESTAPPPKRFVLGMIDFSSGSSEVQSSDALDAIAVTLKDHPGAKVRIDGYADPTGSTAANQKLSRERAQQVKRYLVDRGVATERIHTTGKGETQGAGADQPAAAAESRRVELVILSH
jgi:outer membrane protein OmpA-like peptidoglycan-associated protein